MRALVRLCIAATAVSLALAGAPVGAQETEAPAPAPSPTPSSDDAVGPAQLRDFNLNGTVIRRAEPAPQQAEPAPARRQPSTATATPRTQPGPAQRIVEPEATAPAGPPPRPESSGSAALPPPSPADALFSQPAMLPGDGDSSASFTPAEGAAKDGGGFSPLPWVLAILLLGGAVYYFRRQRSGLALAGGPEASRFVPPEPAPQRLQPKAEPAPAPAAPPPAVPAGIVTTRMAPKLDLQVAPGRLMLEADRLVVEFEVVVLNSGSGPARDVLLEAAMFNAGPTQDKELGAFFESPTGQGDRVPVIGPLKSLGFRSAVTMPRAGLRQFKAGDRTVFVPLVGFNLLYRWSGGDARTSVAFLVGKEIGAERLAPFRLDEAPRTFTGLAVRQLDVQPGKRELAPTGA